MLSWHPWITYARTMSFASMYISYMSGEASYSLCNYTVLMFTHIYPVYLYLLNFTLAIYLCLPYRMLQHLSMPYSYMKFTV